MLTSTKLVLTISSYHWKQKTKWLALPVEEATSSSQIHWTKHRCLFNWIPGFMSDCHIWILSVLLPFWRCFGQQKRNDSLRFFFLRSDHLSFSYQSPKFQERLTQLQSFLENKWAKYSLNHINNSCKINNPNITREATS